MAVKYDAAGLDAVAHAATQHALKLLRIASNGGTQKATKAGVETAAGLVAAQRAGGTTVVPMAYAAQRGGGHGAVVLPPEYFGATSAKCGVFAAQCGGGTRSAVAAALAAEHIAATCHAVSKAVAAADAWVARTVEPKLRAAHPRATWTAARVAKAL